MDKFKIGENAGIIWRMMDNNKHWEYGELKKATGLSDRELNAAIGWLARENKIQFGTDESGQKEYFISTSICLSDNRTKATPLAGVYTPDRRTSTVPHLFP